MVIFIKTWWFCDVKVVLVVKGWCTFRERGGVFDGEVVWFEKQCAFLKVAYVS